MTRVLRTYRLAAIVLLNTLVLLAQDYTPPFAAHLAALIDARIGELVLRAGVPPRE